jgi:hypothetical protein
MRIILVQIVGFGKRVVPGELGEVGLLAREQAEVGLLSVARAGQQQTWEMPIDRAVSCCLPQCNMPCMPVCLSVCGHTYV